MDSERGRMRWRQALASLATLHYQVLFGRIFVISLRLFGSFPLSASRPELCRRTWPVRGEGGIHFWRARGTIRILSRAPWSQFPAIPDMPGDPARARCAHCVDLTGAWWPRQHRSSTSWASWPLGGLVGWCIPHTESECGRDHTTRVGCAAELDDVGYHGCMPAGCVPPAPWAGGGDTAAGSDSCGVGLWTVVLLGTVLGRAGSEEGGKFSLPQRQWLHEQWRTTGPA